MKGPGTESLFRRQSGLSETRPHLSGDDLSDGVTRRPCKKARASEYWARRMLRTRTWSLCMLACAFSDVVGEQRHLRVAAQNSWQKCRDTPFGTRRKDAAWVSCKLFFNSNNSRSACEACTWAAPNPYPRLSTPSTMGVHFLLRREHVATRFWCWMLPLGHFVTGILLHQSLSS